MTSIIDDALLKNGKHERTAHPPPEEDSLARERARQRALRLESVEQIMARGRALMRLAPKKKPRRTGANG